MGALYLSYGPSQPFLCCRQNTRQELKHGSGLPRFFEARCASLVHVGILQERSPKFHRPVMKILERKTQNK